jgi:hypothetical protein
MKTVRRTHVRVTGRVTLVRPEADGDLHIRLSDAHDHFIVAEITNDSPLNTAAERSRLRQAERDGRSITVCGIRRFDDDHGHGWWEVHPIERLEYIEAGR